MTVEQRDTIARCAAKHEQAIKAEEAGKEAVMTAANAVKETGSALMLAIVSAQQAVVVVKGVVYQVDCNYTHVERTPIDSVIS